MASRNNKVKHCIYYRTQKLAFSVELECHETTPYNVKNGLAIEWAFHHKIPLTSLDLRDSFLKNFRLSHADFSNSDLSGSHLNRAILNHCNFFEANLDYTIFNKALLHFSNFEGAFIRHSTFKKADVRNAQFRNADLKFTNMKDTDLSYSRFFKADLAYVNLTRANLKYCEMGFVIFDNANLYQADMGHTLFNKTKFQGVNNIFIFGPIHDTQEYGTVSIDYNNEIVFNIPHSSNTYKKDVILDIRKKYGNDSSYEMLIKSVYGMTERLIWKEKDS